MIRSQDYKKVNDDMLEYEPLRILFQEKFNFIKEEVIDLHKKYM